jgi:superfamily II DNA/RNA helicase
MEFLTDPVQINLGSHDKLDANKAITQTVRVLRESDKMSELTQLLADLVEESVTAKDEVHQKILIFSSLKATCKSLTASLQAAQLSVDCLHGDREQWERTQVMSSHGNDALHVS